jgi:hypothetical protein
LIITITHLAIDIGKLNLKNEKNDRILFLIDQILHLTVIAGVVLFRYSAEFNIENILTKEQQDQVAFIYTSQNACPRIDGDIKCLDKIYKKKNYKELFNSENTLMIDDKFHNMKENTINGIHIPEFKGNSKDDALKKLMEHIKKYKGRNASKFPKNIKW